MLTRLEHKLLVAFLALTCLLSVSGAAKTAIDRYNEDVILEQQLKSSGRERISFSGCNPCNSYPHEEILPIRPLLLLISLGLLLVRSIGPLILSAIPLGIILYGYYDWLEATHKTAHGSEFYVYGTLSINEHLMFNSTILDILLLAAIFAVCVLQTAVTVRFSVEWIRARLTPNDQTPCT